MLYLGVLMADNPERRRFIRMGGGLALAVGAKMLGISTAHAAVSSGAIQVETENYFLRRTKVN